MTLWTWSVVPFHRKLGQEGLGELKREALHLGGGWRIREAVGPRLEMGMMGLVVSNR